MEKINTDSFEKALNSLKLIVERYKKEHDSDIRDAVIQRFEYTYSISLKVLTRYINAHSNEISPVMTFNELIRTANQFDLLKSNLEKWDEFRQKRNMTSHTYDEEIADKVVAIIPDFIDEAEFLLQNLKKRI
ncbi:nucleotidyltransferase substrate binding protein [bacterium]|nr:nucleotidyltransferase substrate binding protein [bacterium]